jgi:hypothetical protein
MTDPVKYNKKLVKIEIETDGTADGTRMFIAGKEQTRLVEIGLTIRSKKMVLLSGLRAVPGSREVEFFSFYGPAAFERLGATAEQVTDADLIGCGLRKQGG